MRSLVIARRCFFALLCAWVVPCEAQESDGSGKWWDISPTVAVGDPAPSAAGRWVDWDGMTAFSAPLAQASGDQGDGVELLDDVRGAAATPSTDEALRVSGYVDPYGLEQFARHFLPYEPIYFVGGPQGPDNIKFQVSFRYQLFYPNPTDQPVSGWEKFLKGINVAYSQTSIWDVSNFSEPFFYDSSYRPEAFYDLDPEDWRWGKWCGQHFDVKIGGGHESNGVKPPNHVTMWILFIQPTLIVDLGPKAEKIQSQWFLKISPKIYDYIGGLSENPDLPKYRGYCDMNVVVGQEGGWQLAARGRVGSEFDRGSGQFDLTCPLGEFCNEWSELIELADGAIHGDIRSAEKDMHVSDRYADFSFDFQVFTGYGDTLLTYNQRTTIFRVGFSFYR